jgi:hypothetical protein
MTMRALLLILCMAAAPALADSEFKHPDGAIVLTDKACPHDALKEEIPPQLRGRMKVLIETYEGKRSEGCWIEYRGSAVQFFLDGHRTAMPMEMFEPAPGI